MINFAHADFNNKWEQITFLIGALMLFSCNLIVSVIEGFQNIQSSI